jgi:tetratricopeptide (TPR) repeat protein
MLYHPAFSRLKTNFVILLFIIFLLFSIRLAAQSPSNDKIAEIERINDFLEKKIVPGFDSISIVATTDSIAKQGDDELAEYTRYFSMFYQAYLNTDKNMLRKRLIDVGAAIADFKTAGVKALHKFRVGDFYFSERQYTSGLNLMLEAKSEMAVIGFDKIPLSGQVLNGLATHYFNFNNYRQCIQFATLAQQYSRHKQGYSALNTWGLAYQKLEIYDSAILKFRETIALAKKENVAVWVSIASGNLGRTLCLQGNVEEGVPLLYTDVQMSRETESINAAISALYIAEAYLQLHRTDSARFYVDLARDIFSKHNPWKGDYFFRSKFCFYYYAVEAKLYEEQGNYSTAIKYKDTANNYEKIYKSQYDWQLLTTSEKKIQGMEYQQSLELVESQKKAERLQKLLLVFVLVGLGIIATLVISRQTIKYKKEKQLAKEKEHVLLLQQQKAEQELETAKLQLDEFVNKIAEKNSLIEKISLELTNNNTAGATVSPEISQHLQNLQESVILTEDDWLAFKKLFEKVWPGFFINLQDQYGELSPAEQRLIALNKLAISSKEMANMLGISVDSLRKSRYRLRKKYPEMGLSGD